MVLALVASDLKAYILEATRTWHVQHEFSGCVCEIVFIRHKDNVLTRGYNKNQIKAVFRVCLPNYGPGQRCPWCLETTM